jgi:cell division transport system permease protein
MEQIQQFMLRFKKLFQSHLALNTTSRAWFFTGLVVFMTCLCALSTSGMIFMNRLTHQWQNDLRGTITIELPSITSNGETIPDIDMQERMDLIQTELKKMLPNDSRITPYKHEEVAAMIEPWIGKQVEGGTIPLPQLLDVETKEQIDTTLLEKMQTSLTKIHDSVIINSHTDWLQQVEKTAGTIKIFLFILNAVIIATTCFLISGAVQDKIAIHHEQIGLLHIMGAFDRNIAQDFLKYATLIMLKACCIGLIIACLIISLIQANIHHLDSAGILSLDHYHVFFDLKLLLSMILIIVFMTSCGLAVTFYTVLNALRKMP